MSESEKAVAAANASTSHSVVLYPTLPPPLPTHRSCRPLRPSLNLAGFLLFGYLSALLLLQGPPPPRILLLLLAASLLTSRLWACFDDLWRVPALFPAFGVNARFNYDAGVAGR